MDKIIEYIYQNFEYIYYKQYSEAKITNGSCMKNEGLNCNCITGIILNYMGYLCSNYLTIPSCESCFKICNGIAYMQVNYQKQALVPIFGSEIHAPGYYLKEWICKQQDTSFEQAYLPFRKYKNIKDLNIHNSLIMKRIMKLHGFHYCYNLQFWLHFLMAMRIQQIDKSSQAFLAMSIFTYPGKTLSYINTAIKNKQLQDAEQLNKLADFATDYLNFINNIDAKQEYGLFFSITKEFSALTDVNLSRFIEIIIQNEKAFNPGYSLKDLFLTSYDHNIKEVKRRKGEFRVLLKELKNRNVQQEKIDNIDSLISTLSGVVSK